MLTRHAEIVEIFTEVIIAPDASDEAKSIVAAKKNLRLLLAGGLPDPKAPGLTFRSLAGGFLVQARDNGVAEADLKIVTKRTPTAAELADLIFAFTVAKHVEIERHRLCQGRSDRRYRRRANVTNRLGAHGGMEGRAGGEGRRPQDAADRRIGGGVRCLLPLPDGLQAIAEAGATAVIQPGGSRCATPR